MEIQDDEDNISIGSDESAYSAYADNQIDMIIGASREVN